MSAVLLSDEVWSQLDPTAARLSRRDRWRLAFATTGLVVALWLNMLAAATGFFRPRIESTGDGDITVGPVGHQLDATVVLRDNGWMDERITAIRTTDPNLRLHVTRLPITIRSHHRSKLAFQVTVRDCSRANSGYITARITVDRLWWHVSRDISLPDYADANGRRNAVAACHVR